MMVRRMRLVAELVAAQRMGVFGGWFACRVEDAVEGAADCWRGGEVGAERFGPDLGEEVIHCWVSWSVSSVGCAKPTRRRPGGG